MNFTSIFFTASAGYIRSEATNIRTSERKIRFLGRAQTVYLQLLHSPNNTNEALLFKKAEPHLCV